MKIKSLAAVSAVIAVIAASLPFSAVASTENFDISYNKHASYSEYLTANTSSKDGDATVTAACTDSGRVKEFNGRNAVAVEENGNADFGVDVPKDGFYNIMLDYYPLSESSSSVKAELYIDGEIPFEGAASLVFKRIWKENLSVDKDSQGNQIRAAASESPMWTTKFLEDSVGMSGGAYKFYLSAGKHKITFSVYQNSLAVSNVKITAPQNLRAYGQLESTYSESGYKNAVKAYKSEAEDISLKSDRSIVVVNDRTSPSVTPQSADKICYNTIGGSSWKTVGEWVQWDIEVAESGLYNVIFRYKQDIKNGDVSYRRMYIDGSVPFAEAENISFDYTASWKTRTFSDKNGEYLIYLEKGKHTLRLEAVLGDCAAEISEANDALSALNKIYTEIVMVTGTDPDTERDYQFEKTMPELIEQLSTLEKKLKDIEKSLTADGKDRNTSAIKRMYVSIGKMVKAPETIAKRLSNFNADITSFASWINDSREQPLQLDSIVLGVPGEKENIKKTGFFSFLGFHIKQFVCSFTTDYANIGNKSFENKAEIRVWVGTGRDQADIIRGLINENFTPEYNVGANVQLVNIGALMPATLSGVGPDVYLSITEEQPVDYALRHAVVDLSKFDDCGEITKRFYSGALESFELDGGLYALPETMSYPMLFYRKDILSTLGIKAEDLETWDRLLQKVLPELDMNYFDFGVPATMKTFASLLYQQGGRFYNDEGTASALDSADGVTSFRRMTSLFTDYGLPKAYDFANRFRSGQMPLAIAEYSSYNQLSIFAPEIEGLWGMLPLPGTEKSDGSIDNTAVATVTGAVILSESKFIDESWSFLKWWTSAEPQTRYAAELEMVMGTGARYAAANIEAAQSVEWSKDIKAALDKQLESVVGMPYIAGGYYTSRSFDFAFRDVVYNGKNLRECIAEADENITAEITNKRKEFYNTKGDE